MIERPDEELAVVVRDLVKAGEFTRAAQSLEARVVPLLASSQAVAARAALEALPAEHRTLLLRVALCDSMRQQAPISSAELQALIAESEAAGRIDLKAWACAMQCEQLVLRGDLAAVTLAHRYLEELPTDPMPPALLLQARGRLRRIFALVYLAAGPSGEKLGREELERAMADCRRADWHTEQWISVSVYYLFATSVSWSAEAPVLNALREARDQLLAIGSSEIHFARYAVLHAAFYMGDRDTLRAELEHLQAMHLTGDAAVFSVLGAHLDAMAEAVLGDHPEALRRLGTAEDMRRVFPSMIGPVLARAANAWLDLGRPDEAEPWYGRLIATTPILPHEVLEREILVCRLTLARGDTSVIDRLLVALEQVGARGYTRVAGGLTLRTAMDAARAGLWDVAQRLRDQAEALLPPPADRNGWELFWGQPVVPAAVPVPSATAGAARSLRLLVPSLQVTVDGEERRLAPGVARLLVVLAGLGRAFSAEELGELLWGDVDPARARRRLKSALHRLRQSLSLGPAELVVRDGEVVRLVAGPGWTIDLHDFHRLAAGSLANRRAALDLVDGVLCNAQFPYDEALAPEREVLAARWTALAGGLIAAGEISTAEVQRRAARAGIAFADE